MSDVLALTTPWCMTVMRVEPADIDRIRTETQWHYERLAQQHRELAENGPAAPAGAPPPPPPPPLAAGQLAFEGLADNVGSAAELGPASGAELPEALAEEPNVTLDARRVARGSTRKPIWKKDVPGIVLLVSSGPMDGPHPPELVGLARLDAHQAGPHATEHQVDISRAELLERRPPWSRVLADLDDRKLVRTLSGRPEPFTGATAVKMLRAAARHAGPDFLERAQAKLRPTGRGIPAAERDWLDRRVRTLEIGRMPRAQPQRLTADQVPAPVYELYERDFLRHDEKAWDPSWKRDDSPDKLWFVYEKDGRRLFVREWDTGPGEHVTGGDMVYLRAEPPSVVAVQYKRLVSTPGKSRLPSCRIDETFLSQVRRLAALSDAPAGPAPADPAPADPAPAPLEEYRMSNVSGFFKLVDSRPSENKKDGYMYDGWYLPADYLKLLLDRAEAAAREPDAEGGTVITLDLDQDRLIHNATFVALVGDGWLGTAGRTTEDLVVRLRLQGLLTGERPSTVAIELPAPPAQQPAQRRPARRRASAAVDPPHPAVP